MSLNAIQRVSAPLRQQVEEAIRNAISEGHFEPGDRLIEREICESLNVSRPSVREALRQLESEGLLKTLPNRGLAVATLSIEEAREIFEVRAGLEGVAAEAFALKASDSEIQYVGSVVTALEYAMENEDVSELLQQKNRFYDAVISGCRNHLLAEMLRNLHNRIQLLRGTSLSEPGRLPNTVAEIRAIYDALVNRDSAEAKKSSTTHIKNAAEVTLNALRKRL